MSKPMVSIITVAYNAAGCISKTIASVCAQAYTDYEYLFVDGASRDNTVEIIESYRQDFEKKGIRYRVISEKDKGIYDAMNKGVAHAEGQWVLMMNAGDCFAHGNVLADIFEESLETADVLYGDVILQDACCYKLSRAQALESITKGMPFCHQCVFVRQTVAAEYRFDLQYRLAADYDQLLRCYRDGKRFLYIPGPVSVYDVSGVSERNFLAAQKEQERVRSQQGIRTTGRVTRVYLLRLCAKAARKLMPRKSRSKARGWYASAEEARKHG